MKRYKFKHPSIQSNLLLQHFVTNIHNTNLPGVNSKDLSESLCLIILLYYNESVIANLIRLHVSLSTICCTLTPSDALARFYGGGRQRWAPKARGRRSMSHVFVWAASLRILNNFYSPQNGRSFIGLEREGGTRDRLALIAFRRALARGTAVCGAEKHPLRSPSSAGAATRGALADRL